MVASWLAASVGGVVYCLTEAGELWQETKWVPGVQLDCVLARREGLWSAGREGRGGAGEVEVEREVMHWLLGQGVDLLNSACWCCVAEHYKGGFSLYLGLLPSIWAQLSCSPSWHPLIRASALLRDGCRLSEFASTIFVAVVSGLRSFRLSLQKCHGVENLYLPK